ncbi:hypothetical protein [Frankia sp. CcWB3]
MANRRTAVYWLALIARKSLPSRSEAANQQAPAAPSSESDR